MGKRIAIEIQGMSCGGCVVAVRNVLGRQTGVGNVEVEVGKATLDVDEPEASEQRLRDAIAKAGFQVTAIHTA